MKQLKEISTNTSHYSGRNIKIENGQKYMKTRVDEQEENDSVSESDDVICIDWQKYIILTIFRSIFLLLPSSSLYKKWYS